MKFKFINSKVDFVTELNNLKYELRYPNKAYRLTDVNTYQDDEVDLVILEGKANGNRFSIALDYVKAQLLIQDGSVEILPNIYLETL